MLEEIPSLPPLHFFTLAIDVPKEKKQLLLDTSPLLGEEPFADVKIAWNDAGLQFEVIFKIPFQGVSYPDFASGEAIELFLDTRDLKTAGFPTRFCHHFLILPKEVGGIQALEITKFRAEESHPLCDPADIFVETMLSKKTFQVKIGLPREILHGYDPRAFDRLGFTYRLHRTGGAPQHFSVSSRGVAIEKHPGLWATLRLEYA